MTNLKAVSCDWCGRTCENFNHSIQQNGDSILHRSTCRGQHLSTKFTFDENKPRFESDYGSLFFGTLFHIIEPALVNWWKTEYDAFHEERIIKMSGLPENAEINRYGIEDDTVPLLTMGSTLLCDFCIAHFMDKGTLVPLSGKEQGMNGLDDPYYWFHVVPLNPQFHEPYLYIAPDKVRRFQNRRQNTPIGTVYQWETHPAFINFQNVQNDEYEEEYDF